MRKFDPKYANLDFSNNSRCQPIKVIYNDDDPIVLDIKKQTSDINKQYNLDKGLSLEVKTLQKYFKFNENDSQTIPVMVSVKTLDTTCDSPQKEEAKNDLFQNRPNIDLICVIDTSGSMAGQKIENVKKTLIYLLELLGDNDRIALVTFNSYATRLCNLMLTDKYHKRYMEKEVIKQIVAKGGTDINSGMDIAFRILKDRKFENPVSSVFLLSDGQDQKAETSVKNSLNRLLPEQCFTIHSFGFGSDHDGPLMNKICQLRDGNFYYVEKITQVDEFFVDALGGLFSIVAQEVEINIQVDLQGQNKKYFKESFVSKTYGDMWKVLKKEQAYKIKINQLFSGVSKDFIFDITVPARKVSELQDFERNAEIVKATVSAIPTNALYSTKVVMENKLTLTLFTNQENIGEDSEVNDNVKFNYLRVQASEAIEQAIEYVEKKEYQRGQITLQRMIEQCEITSDPKNKQRLSVLKNELFQCQLNANPQVYQQKGQFVMLAKKNATRNQLSQAVQAGDLYQNSMQRQMVSKVQQKKDSFP